MAISGLGTFGALNTLSVWTHPLGCFPSHLTIHMHAGYSWQDREDSHPFYKCGHCWPLATHDVSFPEKDDADVARDKELPPTREDGDG